MSSSHSINQQECAEAIVPQTMKPSVDYLSVLPADLLSVVCSYLSFTTKTSLLPLLIPDRFDPSIHCRNDLININQLAFHLINQHPGSFQRTINAAPGVDIRVISGAKHVDSSAPMLAALAKAIENGNLRSLHFLESLPCDGPIAPRLLQLTHLIALNKRPHKLTELKVQVHDLFKHQSASFTKCLWPAANVTSLIRGTALQSLDLDLKYLSSFADQYRFTNLLSALPTSLTHLRVAGSWINQSHIPHSTFSDRTWLPNIRHFEVGKPIDKCPELFTIMDATGQPRPYEWLSFYLEDDNILSHHFAQIKHLELELLCEQPNHLDVFTRLDSSSMPLLKSFSLKAEFHETGNEETIDVNQVFLFLAHRPIEKLVCRFGALNDDDFEPLSAESLQALSTMHSLISLELGVDDSYVADLLADHLVALYIPRNCWPALKSMVLHVRQSPILLTSFLAAALNIEYITLSALSDLSLFPLLPFFLVHQNQLLKSIEMKCGKKLEEPEAQLLLPFAKNPIQIPNLTKFRLWCPKIPNKSLHSFLAKLSCSPVSHFRFPPPAYGAGSYRLSVDLSAFQLVMQRCLTQLTEVWPGRSGANAPCLKGMKRKLADGTSFPFDDTDGSILRFRTVRDEHGHDGRESFFLWLYKSLTENEKATLSAWDRFEYDVDENVSVMTDEQSESESESGYMYSSDDDEHFNELYENRQSRQT